MNTAKDIKRIYKPGEYIILTSQEYSSYAINMLVIVTKEFNTEEVFKNFLDVKFPSAEATLNAIRHYVRIVHCEEIHLTEDMVRLACPHTAPREISSYGLEGKWIVCTKCRWPLEFYAAYNKETWEKEIQALVDARSSDI